MIHYIKRLLSPTWWRIKRMSNSEYWDYRDSILCPMCDESHTTLCDFVDDNIYDDLTDKD